MKLKDVRNALKYLKAEGYRVCFAHKVAGYNWVEEVTPEPAIENPLTYEEAVELANEMVEFFQEHMCSHVRVVESKTAKHCEKFGIKRELPSDATTPKQQIHVMNINIPVQSQTEEDEKEEPVQ